MAPSLLNYKDAFFQIILWSSIVLAIISICIMSSIILVKACKNQRLSKNGDRKKMLSALIYMILDSPTLPIESLSSQKKKGDEPILFEIALNIFRSTHGAIRLRLIQILQACGVEKYAIRLLRGGSRGKKIQALALLAHFPSEKTLDLLLKSVNNDDKYIQLAALYGLATRKAHTYLPQIIDILRSSPGSNTLMLTDVLVKFGEPAIPYLIDLSLTDEVFIEIRLAAIKALGKMRALSAVEPLLTLADAANHNIRAQALLSLMQLGDIRAAPTILQHLQDRESVVRLQAAKAAGSLKLESAISDLTKLLDDDFWWTRYRAAEALYLLGNRGLIALEIAIAQGGRPADIAGQILKEKEAQHA